MESTLSCIFCSTPLDSKTKKQHIIQEAIGGTLSSQRTTCTACNDYFAFGLDRVISNKFELIMNVLGPVIKADGPQITMRLRGSLEPIKMAPGQIPISEPKVERQPDGKASVRGKDLKQAKKLFKSTGNIVGPETKIVYDTIPASGTAMTTLTLLHPDELRAAIKIACEYLCHVDPEMRAFIDLEGAVAIVRRNKGSDALVPVIMRTHPAAELLGAGFTDIPFSHRIWISCDEKNGIQCLIDLFSSVPYRFRLSSYSGKPKTFFYQKNILKGGPADYSAVVPFEVPLPMMPPVPESKIYLKQESQRLGKLHVEALWHVDVTSRPMIVEIFVQGIRAGKSPGDKVDVTTAQILNLMRIRIDRVFIEALKDNQAAAESAEIFRRLLDGRIFKGEVVDNFSKDLEEHIWHLHSQLYTLHKKYVGHADYGAEHYDIFAEPLNKSEPLK